MIDDSAVIAEAVIDSAVRRGPQQGETTTYAEIVGEPGDDNLSVLGRAWALTPPPRLSPRTPAPRHQDGPGRTPGDDPNVQRGRLNPNHRLFGPVTPRTRRQQTYQPHTKIHFTQRGAVSQIVPLCPEHILTRALTCVVSVMKWPHGARFLLDR